MHRIRSVADARQRFTNTVLNDNGKAFYVTGVISEKTLEGVYLSDTNKKVILPLTSELVQPFHVGYTQYRKYAIYTERQPARRVLQGLHPNNLRVSRGNSDNIVYTPEFGKAIAGDYTPIKEAIKLLTEGNYESVAVSREFAIRSKTFKILYQEDEVGRIVDGVPVLDDSRSFLRELFVEVFNA